MRDGSICVVGHCELMCHGPAQALSDTYRFDRFMRLDSFDSYCTIPLGNSFFVMVLRLSCPHISPSIFCEHPKWLCPARVIPALSTLGLILWVRREIQKTKTTHIFHNKPLHIHSSRGGQSQQHRSLTTPLTLEMFSV